MPHNEYEGVSTALNDGLISEERRLTDPNNDAAAPTRSGTAAAVRIVMGPPMQ